MYGAIVAEFRAYVKWICENCCILPDRSDAKKAENAHTDEHDRRQYQNNMRPKRYASFVDAISRKWTSPLKTDNDKKAPPMVEWKKLP